MYGDKKQNKPRFDESVDANVVGRFDIGEDDEEIVRQ